jgi:RHH-type proline utilization regulon transcriptional repressor/proline dehydrogenase/delta 1-pyrroline-5-carboxylate dehydrogenase
MDRPDTAPEQEIRQLGIRLHRAARGARPALFDPGSLRGRLLDAALRDDALRTALFQFVDVLPSLESADAIARHFRAYLHGRRLGGAWGRLLEFGEHPWAAWAVRRSVRRLARQFLVEETPGALRAALASLARVPAGVTVDAVGEAVLTEQEADAYLRRNLDLLEWLRAPGAPPALSLKLSALTPRFDPADPAGTARRVLARAAPLLERAAAAGAQLTLDMESHEFKPLVLEVFRRMAEAWPEPSWLPGIALQAYCPDTEHDLRELMRWAGERRRRIAVRLVKGAYWDTEVALAAARAWPCPVYRDKAQTDAAYERLTELLLRDPETVYPAFASHNLRSLAHAVCLARARGLDAGQWEVQMLYGMAEPLRDALASLGVRLRIYVPTGDLIAGIAYLIRRLMENTAGTSILRQAYAEGRDPAELLAPPAPAPPPGPPPAGNGFPNTPPTDFSLGENRAAFAAGLAAARGAAGRFHPLGIAGAPAAGAGRASSRNPARPAEVLGEVELAGPAQAERAVANAAAAFPGWRDTPAAARAQLCLRAAGILTQRRHELAAWEVLETGKNWREADADVAEAADHLRYCAAEMIRLDGWRATRHFPAERNERRYEPCGVAAVISPWNFPIAILAGMTAAALVAGNTAILKPAGPARLCAERFREVLLEAGFPPGACQLLHGPGEVVGDFLAGHPGVNIIAFTGSREVGLGILARAHRPAPGQAHVKRVVCEMGGKNAIIVDEDADLDEAVAQTFASAFGYQGQKCSACSRLIAVGAVHDRFVARLAAMLDAHPPGPPEDPQYVLGPLISAAAKEKAERYLEIGRSEGILYYRGRAPDDGHYFAPAVFTGIEPRHRLAREEIFAPVLAVLRAGTFEAALDMALDSDYALTGGVFSRLPEHLALARERFRVGNLYLNRRITGALVAAQPFGGWRLSGTGVQAGGPDYLRQFLWSRVVSENTLRHGFVPEGTSGAG